MKPADETFHSTSGFQRITASRPAAKLRLAGLVLTALLGSILVIWVSHTTWDRVDRLQREFAGLKADSFYLGVRMKGEVQRLNDTLLRYRRWGDKADYDLFHASAKELTQWIEANRTHAATPREQTFFTQMGSAYNEYLSESTNVLGASLTWLQTKAGAFPATYEKVQNQSQGLLDLCDAFIRDQRLAFDVFLKESNATLATFQRLLRLSVALLLGLTAALAVLVYRGMIAPLRHQLTESHAVIARQEKLASLGVLAAGVAHEIRNPLTAIKFRLYSLRKSLPPAEADNEDAAVIAGEINRLERIVKDFLQFARPSEPELVAIPAQRVLQEVGDLLRPQLEKAGIELELEPSEPAWLRADPQQIKEVLINLIQNSAESIGRQGTVTLRIRDERDAAVALEVADTGKGIPPDVQKRLFDPFFTTKEGGTGLGLSIAARIVEKHGGWLGYQTQLNRGTTFSVVLPRLINMKPKILLIEDDASTASSLQKVLCAEGYEVEVARRGDDGLAQARREQYDVVLSDLRLPGLSGLELVAQLHADKPKQPIILMTAHGTTETAIEATKLGACDYLLKPFEADELLDLVASAVASSRLMSEPVEIGEARLDRSAIIGQSRAMQAIYKEIGRVAATPASVLIRGATGTGKELVARAIYQHSNRADKPFIAVNCAAIPDALLESELFGHERGAFTGALGRRIGRFEQAHGGTIFLDEIGDLNANTQGKLLRVLQERSIQRLGSEASIPVDVRVLAATHRDLEAAIKEKEFREDLYYRLSVVTITLPPLGERADDIPQLAKYFIHRYGKELGIEAPSVQPEAISFLQSQAWPGNVRELENAIRQALLLARPFAISLEHAQQVLAKTRKPAAVAQQTHAAYIADLLGRAQSGDVDNAYARMIADLEPDLFRQAIQLAQGNQARAARWLGVTRLKMREKLIQLGLHPGREDRDK